MLLSRTGQKDCRDITDISQGEIWALAIKLSKLEANQEKILLDSDSLAAIVSEIMQPARTRITKQQQTIAYLELQCAHFQDIGKKYEDLKLRTMNTVVKLPQSEWDDPKYVGPGSVVPD